MKGKRYIKNTISSAFLQVVTMISGLILPIIILQAYGSTLNGLMNSIKQFISYLTLVEAGLAAVSITSLYKPIAEHNIEEINGILSSSRIFYNKTGTIFSSLVVLMSMIFPYIVQSQVNNVYTILMVLVIGISGTLEYFIIGKYRVLLTADQRGYVITNVQAIGLILNTIATIILIDLKYDLIIVQLISGIIYLMRAIIIKFYVNRVYKDIEFKAKPNNKALGQRWDALVHQIAAMIVFNTDIALLTFFRTLQEVSIYATYRMIFTAIGSLVGIFGAGIAPLLGNLMNESKSKFIQIYNIFENFHFIVLAFIYSATYMLYIPFITIYTRNVVDANYISYGIMLLFIIGEVLNQLRSPANTLVNINGLFKATKNKAILESVINLVVSLLLVNRLGIEGVLIGTICSYVYRTLDFIIYSSRKILNRSSWVSFKIILCNILMSIISILICKNFIYIKADGYFQWIIYAIIISIIVAIIIIVGNIIFNYNNVNLMYKFVKDKVKQLRKKQ